MPHSRGRNWMIAIAGALSLVALSGVPLRRAAGQIATPSEGESAPKDAPRGGAGVGWGQFCEEEGPPSLGAEEMRVRFGSPASMAGRAQERVTVVVFRTGCVIEAWRRLPGESRMSRISRDQWSHDSTWYDLASLTKPLATTALIYDLAARGKLHVTDTIGQWVPGLGARGLGGKTIEDLLLHRSGLPAGDTWRGRIERRDFLERIQSLRLSCPPGSEGCVRYSDLGFILLGLIAERAGGGDLGTQLSHLLGSSEGASAQVPAVRWTEGGEDKRLPLPRIGDSTFAGWSILRLGWPGGLATPTPHAKASVPGVAHDPIARAAAFKTGHAGLFSTPSGGVALAQWWLSQADGEEQRRPQPPSLQVATAPPQVIRAVPWAMQRGVAGRVLGWASCSGGARGGPSFCPSGAKDGTIGHTGYTGTSVWLDPEEGLGVLVLSNRGAVTERTSSVSCLLNHWRKAAATLSTRFRHDQSQPVSLKSASLSSMGPSSCVRVAKRATSKKRRVAQRGATKPVSRGRTGAE